jgi:hypothetical protein
LIRGANGLELLYWPLGRMLAGADSPVLTIQVDRGPGLLLVASVGGTGVAAMGRVQGVGSYVDLVASPLLLNGSGQALVEIFLRAASPLVGVRRVPVTIGAVTSLPAAWTG